MSQEKYKIWKLKSVLPWFLFCALSAVTLYVISVKFDGELRVGLSTLASSFISIAVALAISEWALKQIYINEMLSVSGLNRQVFDAGLERMAKLQDYKLADELKSGGRIYITGNTKLIERIWTSVLEVSKNRRSEVTIVLQSTDDTKPFEESWKRHDPVNSSLVIHGGGHEEMPPLTISIDGKLIVAVSDGEIKDGNPILLQFNTIRERKYVETISGRMRRLCETDAPPLYESKASRRKLTSVLGQKSSEGRNVSKVPSNENEVD